MGVTDGGKTPGPAGQCYCLCVKVGDDWVRAVTVWGSDQLDAYDRAVRELPDTLRDKPRMFRATHLCPP
jgi:hypothetical protein